MCCNILEKRWKDLVDYKRNRYFEESAGTESVVVNRQNGGRACAGVQALCVQKADLQYIEAKYRNNSVIKDSDGIVVFGTKDTPGYVITKDPDDYGLTERKQTKLYRIPAVAYFYLIGKMN